MRQTDSQQNRQAAPRHPTRRFTLAAVGMVIAMQSLFILLLVGLTVLVALFMGMRVW